MLHDDGKDESNELVPDKAVLYAFDGGVYLVTEFGAIPLVDHPELLDDLRDCGARYAEQSQANRGDADDAPTVEGLFQAGVDGAVWYVDARSTLSIDANPELHRRLIERCQRYAEIIGWDDLE